MISKVIAVLIVLIALALVANGYMNCSEQGGTYVRGVFWMECLRGLK